MPKSVHITVSQLSQQERAKRLRIPKAREKQLRAIVDKGLAILLRQEEETRESIEPEKRRKRASAA